MAPSRSSFSIKACAEQEKNLGYENDKKVRIADCSRPPQWKSTIQSEPKCDKGGKTCQASCHFHENWDQANQESVYGPFWGVYASSDEKIRIDQNLADHDVMGI